jgi:hypothetical protein
MIMQKESAALPAVGVWKEGEISCICCLTFSCTTFCWILVLAERTIDISTALTIAERNNSQALFNDKWIAVRHIRPYFDLQLYSPADAAAWSRRKLRAKLQRRQ